MVEWVGCNERKAFESRRVRVDCEDYERLQRYDLTDVLRLEER